MDKLDIWNELLQFDRKNRAFYDELDDQERKKFGVYVLMKWGANVEGSADLQEWYLRAVNERSNVNFFDLGRHPKLQWLCLTSASPGLGKQRHYWQKPRKREGTASSKAVSFLRRNYPHLRTDELELMAQINDIKDLKALARSQGMTDAEIKKELG